MLEAAERADYMLEEGDMAGAETWHRILNAIERLQVKAPAGVSEYVCGSTSRPGSAIRRRSIQINRNS